MIYLGYPDDEKCQIVTEYVAEHGIDSTVMISADGLSLPIVGADQVQYRDTIMYVTFYRLLQTITPRTLVVLNECLRSQNRYDLTYNCIRNFLNLTSHQLIFQQLPLIDTQDDFMILFDLDTRSRWKRRPFDAALIASETPVQVQPLPVEFVPIAVPTSAATQERYAQERERLFRELGHRDPHLIPRQLYLLGGADKLAYVDAQRLPLFGDDAQYVARNARLHRDYIGTYADVQPGQSYTIVELPHRFIDFTDFLRRTGQTRCPVLVADLKVDRWYLARYQEWAGRLHDTYAAL